MTFSPPTGVRAYSHHQHSAQDSVHSQGHHVGSYQHQRRGVGAGGSSSHGQRVSVRKDQCSTLPHSRLVCVSPPTGHRDVGAQRSEPDAVGQGDGQGGGGSFHQDPNGRRLHPPLGQEDPLVPVRQGPAVLLLHGGATEPSGRMLNGQIHTLSEL